jgi:hypothetical protein
MSQQWLLPHSAEGQQLDTNRVAAHIQQCKIKSLDSEQLRGRMQSCTEQQVSPSDVQSKDKATMVLAGPEDMESSTVMDGNELARTFCIGRLDGKKKWVARN